MRPADVFALALETLRRHRLRTGLSMLAVAIGVLAVLLLTTLGDAAKRYVVVQFASYGSNIVSASPGRTDTFGMAGAVGEATRPLTIDDCDAVLRRCPAVREVVPVAVGSSPVQFGDRSRDVYVVGTTAAYAEVRGLAVTSGRFLPAGDVRRGERVAVLGSRLRSELFGATSPVGARVRIGETPFLVIGVLESKGRVFGMDQDDLVLVPVASAQRLFNDVSLHRAMIQARDAAGVPRVVAQARAVLIDRHRDEDFTLVTQDALLASMRSIVDALTAALAAIAAISLAVAGIGIMNVMLVSVSDRIGEIGLLKALGARAEQIRALFLAEAVLLAGAGALAGIVGAVALVAMAGRVWPQVPFVVHPLWALLDAVLALGFGALFGFLPARRAARLPAVEALGARR